MEVSILYADLDQGASGAPDRENQPYWQLLPHTLGPFRVFWACEINLKAPTGRWTLRGVHVPIGLVKATLCFEFRSSLMIRLIYQSHDELESEEKQEMPRASNRPNSAN